MPSNELSSTTRHSLEPTTLAEAFQFAERLARSTMVPPDYRGKPENVLVAVQWGKELGLAPLQAIQSIALINGKPCVYGDALLAIVRGSPLCDDVIERYEGEGDGLTAVCEARRKGKAPVVARFSMADAKRAGLAGKSGTWAQYPRRMLQWRARGFALRDAFPDLLRGVITREEAEDIPRREPIDITPPAAPVNTAADLDAFAADAPVVDEDVLRLTAEAAAMQGTEMFRAFWGPLSALERNLLRPDLSRYQGVAAEADADRARDEDPFGLPPIGEAQAAPIRYALGAAPEDQATGPLSEAPAAPFAAAVRALVPVAGDDGEPNWRAWSEAFVALVEQATPAEARKCRLSDLPHYGKCRTEDGDAARAVLEAVNAKSKEGSAT
jgi:hypothetical protein